MSSNPYRKQAIAKCCYIVGTLRKSVNCQILDSYNSKPNSGFPLLKPTPRPGGRWPILVEKLSFGKSHQPKTQVFSKSACCQLHLEVATRDAPIKNFLAKSRQLPPSPLSPSPSPLSTVCLFCFMILTHAHTVLLPASIYRPSVCLRVLHHTNVIMLQQQKHVCVCRGGILKLLVSHYFIVVDSTLF